MLPEWQRLWARAQRRFPPACPEPLAPPRRSPLRPQAEALRGGHLSRLLSSQVRNRSHRLVRPANLLLLAQPILEPRRTLPTRPPGLTDRKSTRLNSSHL